MVVPTTRADEDALLDLLNSTPLVDGVQQDHLSDETEARAWLRERGGSGSRGDRDAARRARAALQAVVRGEQPPTVLAPFLEGVSYRPVVSEDGVEWSLDAPAECTSAVRAVLSWSALERTRPGRLRPCANGECHLFLLDRSKTNQARWCSMAVCGNRMKARRHYQRARQVPVD
jgi:predicted RNA-binding Zn ribbon-like protein